MSKVHDWFSNLNGCVMSVPILTNCIVLVFNLCSSLNGHPNRSGSCMRADAEDWISWVKDQRGVYAKWLRHMKHMKGYPLKVTLQNHHLLPWCSTRWWGARAKARWRSGDVGHDTCRNGDRAVGQRRQQRRGGGRLVHAHRCAATTATTTPDARHGLGAAMVMRHGKRWQSGGNGSGGGRTTWTSRQRCGLRYGVERAATLRAMRKQPAMTLREVSEERWSRYVGPYLFGWPLIASRMDVKD
jgi:hypothetical protein